MGIFSVRYQLSSADVLSEVNFELLKELLIASLLLHLLLSSYTETIKFTNYIFT